MSSPEQASLTSAPSLGLSQRLSVGEENRSRQFVTCRAQMCSKRAPLPVATSTIRMPAQGYAFDLVHILG